MTVIKNKIFQRIKAWRKIAAVAFSFSVFVFPAISFAAGVPSVISYQGRLLNSSGSLVGSSSGTTYYFKFSIWDTATIATGNKLWPSTDPQTTSLLVRQGVFNVDIGGSGYPDTLDYNFGNATIYLQVEVSSSGGVGTFETLSPRQRISSTAFSQLSGAVSGLGQSSFGTTTPISGSAVTIEATSTATTGLSIRGILGQIANLFQVQDSTGTNLFVVNSSGKVGVGTSTPNRRLNILDVDSTPQLRIGQSSTAYGEIQTDSSGDLLVSSTGGNTRENEGNVWVCSGGACGVEGSLVDPGSGHGNAIVENSVILGNKFRIVQTGVSTTMMYDPSGNEVLEFDEGS